MFLSYVFMGIAGLGIKYLWEEIERDEATARYEEEIRNLYEEKERKVYDVNRNRKGRHHSPEGGCHSKCC